MVNALILEFNPEELVTMTMGRLLEELGASSAHGTHASTCL